MRRLIFCCCQKTCCCVAHIICCVNRMTSRRAHGPVFHRPIMRSTQSGRITQRNLQSFFIDQIKGNYQAQNPHKKDPFIQGLKGKSCKTQAYTAYDISDESYIDHFTDKGIQLIRCQSVPFYQSFSRDFLRFFTPQNFVNENISHHDKAHKASQKNASDVPKRGKVGRYKGQYQRHKENTAAVIKIAQASFLTSFPRSNFGAFLCHDGLLILTQVSYRQFLQHSTKRKHIYV